jgi:hypothetical protein
VDFLKHIFLLLFVVSDCKRCRTRGRCATFSGLIRTIGNVGTCVWYTAGMRSYRGSQRMVCDFASPILFAHKDRIQIFCQFRILVFFFIVVQISVADPLHFGKLDTDQDPHPHQSGKPDPHSHQSEKQDPNLKLKVGSGSGFVSN